MKSLSRVRLFATPWTAACQAPPPMGFPRQEYWSGLPYLAQHNEGHIQQTHSQHHSQQWKAKSVQMSTLATFIQHSFGSPSCSNQRRKIIIIIIKGIQTGKESTCNARDLGSIPGLGRSPGEGNGYPPQYSDLENSMDCRVHGVAKSWTWLSNFHSRWVIAKLSDCSFFKSEAIWKLCLGQIKLILLSCFAFF